MSQRNGEAFYQSSTFTDNMVNGKWEDPTFPANDSSLYWGANIQDHPGQRKSY